MRETTPYLNVDADTYLLIHPELRPTVEQVRREKLENRRLKPSASIIDSSQILNPAYRLRLVDRIAALVDENITGRSDMCQQVAELLVKALNHLGFEARVAIGTATYYDSSGDTIFKWNPDGHDWVIVENELIDANVDILHENPAIPVQLQLKPYWGPIKAVPRDRKFLENKGARTRVPDDDIESHWWPDLKVWLTENFAK